MIANIKELNDILIPHSDCGSERQYSEYIAGLLSEYTDIENITVDSMNNVIAYIGDKSKYTVMLEAHIDEISMMVQNITDNGFIQVRNIGGIDRRTLPASAVTINGLPGIVCNVPPHLASSSQAVPEYKDLYIDLGLPVDDVKKKVRIGDKILQESGVLPLEKTVVAARAHDDRICLYSILIALRKLKKYIVNNKLECCIAVLFGTQEEIGSYGAIAGTFDINPDEALVTDVTFADEPLNKFYIKMGKGAVIERSAYFDRNMVRELCSSADKRKIKHQCSVEAVSGGTDAADIHLSCASVSTVLLSIPLKHMHTPTEVVDLKDVESLGGIIAGYIIDKFGSKGA